MNRRAGLIAGAALVGLAMLTFVASSDPVTMWHEPTTRSSGDEIERDDVTRDTRPVEVRPTTRSDDPASSWLDDVLSVVFFATVAAGAALLIVFLLRRRRGIVVRPSIGGGPAEPLPNVHDALVEASAESADVLAEGTARNAIVACWSRLEGAVVASGMRRDPAETSIELTERVMGTYVVDAKAITTLAALYREARFSTHQLDESHRRLAVDALGELNTQLRHPSPVAAAMP